MALVESIRNDTVLNQNYWDAGYEKGQEFTKGMAAARRASSSVTYSYYGPEYDQTYRQNSNIPTYAAASGYATGIDYVPYDNFPALLHQGERVQTAVEARSERGGLQRYSDFYVWNHHPGGCRCGSCGGRPCSGRWNWLR